MIKKLALLWAVNAALFVVSCGSNNSETTTEKKVTAVTVDIANKRDLEIKSVYTGTLEGYRQAQIFASIPEAVVDLPMSEGSRVKAGQPIILLDKGGTYSKYNQSKAVYLEAKDNFDKMKKLFEQGAISEQAYNGARTNFEVASANYLSARQQVELTSPINGVLTDLSVNIGEFVQLGVPLATIAHSDKMRMTLYVDGRSASNIKVGQKADISVEILGRGGPKYTGTVSEVSRSADEVTRLFKVEIEVDNKDGAIKPGTFARAQLTIADLESALSISKEAVFSVEGVSKVYVVNSGHAVERTIGVGESTDEYTQINSGLAVGDTVIVIGRNLIEDGSAVRIVEGIDDGADVELSGTEPRSEG